MYSKSRHGLVKLLVGLRFRRDSGAIQAINPNRMLLFFSVLINARNQNTLYCD